MWEDLEPMLSLSYVVGAVLVGMAGGFVAAWWSPSRWVTSHIQHFTAGVVIAAVALKVAPDIEGTGARPAEVLVGFLVGGLVMIGLKWWTLRLEKHEREASAKPWGLTAAAAVDTLIDGTIIGA